MGFRAKYKKATGLRFLRTVHVHHIDKNRTNNNLSNLVHLSSLVHMRYHYYMTIVNDHIHNALHMDMSIHDLNSSEHNRSRLVVGGSKKGWAKILLSCEQKMLKKIAIRNKRTGITDIPVFITKEQRQMIEVFINHP